ERGAPRQALERDRRVTGPGEPRFDSVPDAAAGEEARGPDRRHRRWAGDLSLEGARGGQGGRPSGRETDSDRDAGRDSGGRRPDYLTTVRVRVSHERDGSPGPSVAVRRHGGGYAREIAVDHDCASGGVRRDRALRGEAFPATLLSATITRKRFTLAPPSPSPTSDAPPPASP